jgi:hypothetical protein
MLGNLRERVINEMTTLQKTGLATAGVVGTGAAAYGSYERW